MFRLDVWLLIVLYCRCIGNLDVVLVYLFMVFGGYFVVWRFGDLGLLIVLDLVVWLVFLR